MLAHLSASADGEGGGLEVGKLLRLADRNAAKRERQEAARERVAADVLGRLPNGGEVRVTPGRLATDALDRARELGRPGLALDRTFVSGVAKGYLAGQLGATVLDD
jgi:hypothetical protein